METDKEIFFYKVNDNYGYMSNFYKVEMIDENNIKYNCSEQYFMYAKCKLFDGENKDLLDKILKETSPTQIKKYGRQVNNFNLDIWNKHKYNIMVSGLKLKFTQNIELKKKLMETGEKHLYEASKYDNIWGIGYYDKDAIKTDRSEYGSNLLGKALMEVRSQI